MSEAERIFAFAMERRPYLAREALSLREDDRIGDPQYEHEVGERAAIWARLAINDQRSRGGEDIPVSRYDYLRIAALALGASAEIDDRVESLIDEFGLRSLDTAERDLVRCALRAALTGGAA